MKRAARHHGTTHTPAPGPALTPAEGAAKLGDEDGRNPRRKEGRQDRAVIDWLCEHGHMRQEDRASEEVIMACLRTYQEAFDAAAESAYEGRAS